MLAVALCLSAWQQSAQPLMAAAAGGAVRLPERLQDTGLYVDGRLGQVDPRNRHFSPQYPLWSDGLLKRRWVYLPEGARIDVADPDAWDLPVGTRFWKEFSLKDRKVETRLLWKVSTTDWAFGSYVWNEDNTEAVLAPEAGIRGVVEVAPGRRFGIPSRTDCTACHGTGTRLGPLGFNRLQLSTDRDPNALHGEPLRPEMLTLEMLGHEGRLSPVTASDTSVPPRIQAADPATRAMLGYLAANCGVCHNGGTEIAGFNASLAYRDVMADADGVMRQLLDQPTRWQLPGVPIGQSVLIRPGASHESAMLARMRSRAPSSQMPALGTVVRDDEAVAAMTRWIDVTLVPSH